jgi:hypothetical protein
VGLLYELVNESGEFESSTDHHKRHITRGCTEAPKVMKGVV